MAYKALKRPLDWESLNQLPAKRRCCNQHGQNRSTSLIHLSSTGQCVSTNNPSSSSSQLIRGKPTPFFETTLAKISPEKMAQNIRDEIKRLRKHNQLQVSAGDLELMQMSGDSESSGSEMGSDTAKHSVNASNIIRDPEKALFTFKQVHLICDRMLIERENLLREEYDTVLTNKLAEQYDTFVKFTYDQIQRRYKDAPFPSYLS